MIRAVVVVAVAATPAFADHGAAAAPGATAEVEPDPAALDAGDANLEPVGERDGITVSFALGGALTLGFGIEDATGRGGAATIRVGRVATKRTLITLEFTGSALFHGATMGETARNDITSLAVGAQYYARSRLWTRVGVGYAVYAAHAVLVDKMTGDRDDVTLQGVAGTFGIGVEVAKWRRVALQLEALSTAMINRDGVLSSSALLVGLTID